MFKKILLSLAFCTLCFGDLTKQDENDLAFLAVIQSSLDGDLSGKWYLFHSDKAKYKKTKNNEFEWHDTLTQAKDDYKKAKEKYQTYDKDKIFTFFAIGAEFGEYNFEKEGFPVKKLLSADSWFDIGSIDDFGNFSDLESWFMCKDSTLVFDNIDENRHFAKMPKDKAKEFVANNSHRSVAYDVEFVSSKNELVENITDEQSCAKVKITGHIKKIIIRNRITDDILSVIEYD